MRLAAASVSLLVVLAPVRTAGADPATEARFFDQLARRSYADGDYETALRNFLLAHDAAPSPPLLYNLALCAELSEKPDLAWSWFDAYLASADPDEGRREEALRRREQLGQRLAILRVTTDPPGARLYVDRREHGAHGTAPAAVAVQPGAVRLIAELGGHHPVEQRIEAAVGTVRQVSLSLPPRMGRLRVRAVPDRATVRLMRGDSLVQELESGQTADVPIGRYRLVAELEGHLAAEASVTVSEGALERRRLVLPRAPVVTGRLLVATGDVRARLLVDGRPLAETPATLDAVPAGRHQIEIRAADHHPVRRTVIVRPNETTYLDITLVER